MNTNLLIPGEHKDLSNKHQLMILISIVVFIAVLLVIYINVRPQSTRMEQLPMTMQNIIKADSKRDSTLANIYAMVLDLKIQLNHFPSTPLSISDLSKVSSTFNTRQDPVTGGKEFHTGIDYMAKYGSAVFAAADGIVTKAGWDYDYGNTIKIDHQNGYITTYAHLAKINVSTGDKVSKGDSIGMVGMTGKATGPHLHYEIAYNDNGKLKRLNPAYFTQTVAR